VSVTLEKEEYVPKDDDDEAEDDAKTTFQH
jgi:hypothetical protein